MQTQWSRQLLFFILAFALSFGTFLSITRFGDGVFFGTFMRNDFSSLGFYSLLLTPVFFLLILLLSGDLRHAFTVRDTVHPVNIFPRSAFMVTLLMAVLVSLFSIRAHAFPFQNELSLLSLGQSLYLLPLILLQATPHMPVPMEFTMVALFWGMIFLCGGYLVRRGLGRSRLLLGLLIGLLLAGFALQGHIMAAVYPNSVSGLFGGNLFFLPVFMLAPLITSMGLPPAGIVILFWLLMGGCFSLICGKHPARLILMIAIIFSLLPLIFFSRGCHGLQHHSYVGPFAIYQAIAGGNTVFGVNPFDGTSGQGVDITGLRGFLEGQNYQNKY